MFARTCELQRFCCVFRRMMMKVHIECNALLVFFKNGHGETEADDDEIYRRSACGQRRDPTARARRRADARRSPRSDAHAVAGSAAGCPRAGRFRDPGRGAQPLARLGQAQSCEVEVVLDRAEDAVGDLAGLAHPHDRSPLGVERELLQTAIDSGLGDFLVFVLGRFSA